MARHGERLTPTQRKVLAVLAACRTPVMGTHLYLCKHCGRKVPLYNSCGDRHCPKCQAGQRAAWLEKRRRELLPVEYFQLVFTLSHDLAPLAISHPRVFYTQVFRAVQDTLLEIAASPEHLGAAIGGLMVLHTWGQNLHLHPHVHVIVPGGGLSADGQRWRSSPRGFFLPVKVLSAVFRGKLLDYLKQEHTAGRIPMSGGLSHLAEPKAFARWLSSCYDTGWNVHADPPEDRPPEQVLKYLARYTYRVAISNDRLESIDDGQVTFRYKDYARGGRWQRMTLDAHEFLRRFLQHVLPPRFMRLRAFGFFANRRRGETLARIRRLLGVSQSAADAPVDRGSAPRLCCPYCGQDALRLIGETPRPSLGQLVARTYQPKAPDSS